MTRKEYYATRRPFTPEYGEEYENEGGGWYRCIDHCPKKSSALMRSAGGYVFRAINIGIYADGKIDWDYSKGGHLEK